MPPIDVALAASETMAAQESAEPPTQDFILGGPAFTKPTVRETVQGAVGAAVMWPIVVTGTALSLTIGWPGVLL